MEKSELRIDATQVREILSRNILADGLDLVADLEKSRGAYLYDAKRDKYFLDFFSCFATCPLGYNHPRLNRPETIEALGRAAVNKPSNSDIYTRQMAEFVDIFSEVAKPDFMRYLFFIDGGALAVENALKTAFDWKVRKNLAAGSGEEKGFKVIHFREAFHGRTGYTLSLTNTADPRKIQYFPKFDWPRILNPKCVFPLQGENLARVEEAEQLALAQIREVLDKEAENVACLILEPIQAEGGDNHFRLEFHQQLRKICDHYDTLFIYDEVQTGFGGSGRMWAYEHYVKPDIISFGKKTQICGIMVSQRVDEVADNVFHVSSRLNSTWGGNLVDMVRSRTYLEIYRDENILEQCRKSGELLLAELRKLEGEFSPKVTNSRGLGLLCAFDLPSPELRKEFLKQAFENRLIMLPCGVRSVRFRTALNIPQEDLLKGLEIIRKVLTEL